MTPSTPPATEAAGSEPVLTIAAVGDRPEPAEVAGVGRLTNGLVCLTGFNVEGTFTAERLQEIASLVRSPFVVIADRRNHLDLRATLERTALLLANPSAVLAYGPTGAARAPLTGTGLPSTWTEPPRTPFGDLPSPAVLVGRSLLLHMLTHATNVLGLPHNVVIRASALRQRPSLSIRPFTRSAWHLELWARLLAGGSAIYSPGLAAGPPTADEATGITAEEVAWWPSILVEARRLKVLDSTADFRCATDAYDHRHKILTRHGLIGPELLRLTAECRRRVLAQRHDLPVRSTGKLEIHAVVMGFGPAPFVQELREKVAMVSRIETELPQLLAPYRLDEVLREEQTLPEPVRDAARGRHLPLLLLGVDESLDVRDMDQIRRLLPALAKDNQVGAVRVPGGWSRRLWGNPTAESHRCSRPVYSVIINGRRDREWLPPPTGDQLEINRSRRRRFIVTAPSYDHRSGGIAALHRLCDLLNKVGTEAYIVPLGADLRLLRRDNSFTTNPDWLTPLAGPETVDKDAIVIYPEVITGNPLGASNVVRWLLNRPGVITGRGMDEAAGDLQVAFDSSFGRGKPLLRLPQVDPRIFFPKDVPGEGGLLWIYKGNMPLGLERGGLVEILKDWPADKDSLASLLRSATELLSCDWCTVLTHEAAMCGTPALLVRGSHDQFSACYVDGDPLGPEWLDLRPMLRVDGTDAGDAVDGSAAVFHAYLDHVSMWAGELTGFVHLADEHFGCSAGLLARPEKVTAAW